MATKYICDQCGSEDHVGRVTLKMAVAQPHKTDGLPENDQDLCPDCLKKLSAAVKELLKPPNRVAK
jgi:hypothetical protein